MTEFVLDGFSCRAEGSGDVLVMLFSGFDEQLFREVCGLVPDSSERIIPPPEITCCIPLRITSRPLPPASTTPAFFSAGSSSGVFARLFSPSSMNFARNSAASPPSCAESFVFSHASLTTVSMVPSVGFITDLYAASTPSLNASDSILASASA